MAFVEIVVFPLVFLAGALCGGLVLLWAVGVAYRIGLRRGMTRPRDLPDDLALSIRREAVRHQPDGDAASRN